jgi:hypothetical protein
VAIEMRSSDARLARLGLCVAALAAARGAPLAQGTSELSALVSPGLTSRLGADERVQPEPGWVWSQLLHGGLINSTAPAADNRTAPVLPLGTRQRRHNRQGQRHVTKAEAFSAEESSCVPAFGTALHAETFTWIDVIVIVLAFVSPPFMFLYAVLEGTRASRAKLMSHVCSFMSRMTLRHGQWWPQPSSSTSDPSGGVAQTEEHTAQSGAPALARQTTVDVDESTLPPPSSDSMPMSFKGGLSLIFEGVGQPPDVALHLLHEIVEIEYAALHGPLSTHHTMAPLLTLARLVLCVSARLRRCSCLRCRRPLARTTWDISCRRSCWASGTRATRQCS